jgi:phosphotransferase system enzyme I (PtsI)
MGEFVRGIGVSSGVAVGRVFLLHAEPLPVVPQPIPPERVDEEIEWFHRARELAARELAVVKEQVDRALGERYAGIFDAQRLVLDDPSLVAATVQRIRIGRVSARWALKETVREFVHKLDAVEDEYIRERGAELADVQRRLQRLLRGEGSLVRELPHGPLIVVARSIGPSDALLLAGEQVTGLATDVGGRTSHTTILARALALPAVVGLHDFSRRVRNGDRVILDGDSGELILAPSAEELARAELRRRQSRDADADLASSRELEAATRDGVEVVIRANIEFPAEVERAQQYGAHGIGLYRSEFLFLSRSPALPDEEDHYRTYLQLARKVEPHPVVVRTLDLGGEKYFHEVLDRDDPNPVLGLRGIRFSLRRPEIFRPQLRGLLRAAAEAPNLRMMLPLVTTVGEVQAAREMLAEEVERLRAAGRAARAELEVGIMIEVPAAALAADELAAEADFFSIGTNDLVQYTLAVDRANESLDPLYQPMHPGLLRLLHWVVEASRRHDTPLAICGEMAADPAAVALLVGLGLRDFSVHPRAVATVRAAVRELDAASEELRVRAALGLEGSGTARERLDRAS